MLKAVTPTTIFPSPEGNLEFGGVPGVAFGGNFYFSARANPANPGSDYQLWKTDGTPTGTVAVTKVDGPNGLAPRDLVLRNNTLFFGGEDRKHGRELWQLPVA